MSDQFWLALIEALHAGIAIESVVIALYYAGPVMSALREDRAGAATHFLLALWMLWASIGVLYVPLLAAYVTRGADPILSSLLPLPLRVASLTAQLTAGAYFIAARRDGGLMWPRFWLWSAGMAAVLLAFIVVEQP